MKRLTYDCEILNDPTVYGWRNYKALGITVIGCHADWLDSPLIAFDCRSSQYLSEFQALVREADQIIGFNSISFDDELCRAHGVDIFTDIDLLCEIRLLSGQPAFYTPGLTRGGYSLGATCEANGLGQKSGHGAEAPLQWQGGEHQSVIDYCLHDVSLTRGLFDLWNGGEIVDPTNGELLLRRA